MSVHFNSDNSLQGHKLYKLWAGLLPPHFAVAPQTSRKRCGLENLESPYLENFKSCLHTVLGNLLWGSLAWVRGWTTCLERSLPTSTLLLFWENTHSPLPGSWRSSNSLPAYILSSGFSYSLWIAGMDEWWSRYYRWLVYSMFIL